MQPFQKILLTWAVVLACLPLGSCFSKDALRQNEASTSAPEQTTSPLEALEARLEQLYAAQKLQNTAYEERLQRLEQALSAAGSSTETAADVLEFTYQQTEAGLVLTGWSGSAKTLTIPAKINGKPVVAIGDGAFQGKEVQQVVIPSGIVSIGWFAFSGCYQLSAVTLPDSVSDIGYGAFERCAATLRFHCSAGSYAAQYAKSYGFLVSIQ